MDLKQRLKSLEDSLGGKNKERIIEEIEKMTPEERNRKLMEHIYEKPIEEIARMTSEERSQRIKELLCRRYPELEKMTSLEVHQHLMDMLRRPNEN